MSYFPESHPRSVTVSEQRQLLATALTTGALCMAAATLLNERYPRTSLGIEIAGGAIIGAVALATAAEALVTGHRASAPALAPTLRSDDWVLYDRVFHHFGG